MESGLEEVKQACKQSDSDSLAVTFQKDIVEVLLQRMRFAAPLDVEFLLEESEREATRRGVELFPEGTDREAVRRVHRSFILTFVYYVNNV